MKGGRSHRPEPPPPAASAAPAADEWGDGSWTVDCSCGVTFDDGEEMVSCDECGVWVHTRCSRYVHGAHNSFSCHNCKSKHADADEAEVAELLAELPTKSPAGPGPLGHRPFYRRWAEVPLPDRVHVHGPPGGDPAIFRSVLTSSAFSAALWHCAGYVPKKFGFRYREFPSWYDEDGGRDGGAGQGADALFALSKDKAKDMKEAAPAYAIPALPQGGLGKILEPRSSVKKEKSRIQAIGAAAGGKKKDEAGDGKDRSARKRPAAAAKKRAGSVPVVKSDAHVDRGQQVGESTGPEVMYDNKNVEICVETIVGSSDKQDLIKVDKGEEIFRPRILEEMYGKAEKDEQFEPVKTEVIFGIKARSAAQESLLRSEVLEVEEVTTQAKHDMQLSNDDQCTEGSYSGGSHSSIMNTGNLDPATNDLRCSQDLPEMTMHSNSSIVTSLSVKQDKVVKMEDGKPPTEDAKIHSVATEKLHEGPDNLHTVPTRSSQLPENLQDSGDVPTLQFGEPKSQNIKTESTYQNCDGTTEDFRFRNDEPGESKQGLGDSASLISERVSSKLAHDSPALEHTSSEPRNQTHIASEFPKSILGVPKVCRASSGPIFSRLPELSHSLGSTETSSAGKTVRLIKKEPRKLALSADTEESIQEYSRRSEKSQPKSSISSAPKSSRPSKTYASSTKHKLPVPREQLQKAGAIGDAAARSFPGELTSSQCRNKPMSPSFCQKKEKIHHRVVHTALEGSNNSIAIDLQASDATALLSDEQLALLLHQQLNSSPRVPRVPRGRQAVGMQMAHPTAATVSSKRSSATGGRDQALVFKKKKKDDKTRDNSCSYESNDDTKRMGKVSYVEQRHSDSITAADGFSVKDSLSRLADNTQSKRLNGAISSSEHSTSPSVIGADGSVHTCARDDSMDSHVPCSLPGLIEEIFSKNRHITYTELCDAVHPHWQDLRKPNGERYAYPSYVHAVNDCLRNRSEWAHLIDQASKSNTTKKRRKPGSDSTLASLLETEKMKNKYERNSEERSAESQQEDIPRGKRKARKRRRLELRGRRVEDVRKRPSNVSSSEDDPTRFSDSTSGENDAPFSEESQDDKSGGAKTGADMEADSASSSSADAN